MAADIKPFILSHLLDPLKYYPTVIQDTMIEIIAQKLQELYDYTFKFPEIVSPDDSRLDILQAIADQFLFKVREDADIQEQIDILENILYVYRKRGSIDTIENMWKYYGGELPKNVKVIIPSYNLFRYSKSALSSNHVFQDNGLNRTGSYEIRLINNKYPISDLKEFLLKELVAAGNKIYFSNAIHVDMTIPDNIADRDNYFKYNADRYYHIQRYLYEYIYSAEDYKYVDQIMDITYINVSRCIELLPIIADRLESYPYIYNTLDLLMRIEETGRFNIIKYITNVNKYYHKIKNTFVYCTPSEGAMYITRYYNGDKSKEEIIGSHYYGYFVLGETLLGKEVV